MADVFEGPQGDPWALNTGWRASCVLSTAACRLAAMLVTLGPPGAVQSQVWLPLPHFFTTEETVFMTVKQNGSTPSKFSY